MADPIIQGGIRAIVELKLTEESEEDVYVNTWAFARATAGSVTESDLADVADALDDFYTSIESRFGKQVGFIQAKLYDLGQPPPRDPETVILLEPVTAAQSLPSELAVALTFYATTPRPRNRGRVFLGPLRTDAIDHTTPVPRVAPAFRAQLQTSAQALVGLTSGVRWCVLSQRDASLKQVTAGWIDDAFDIQRRRGEDPGSRTNW